MGKISSLLCRELHAQPLLTTVIVHIISSALLWKFTLRTLAPCQVTQQPFIIFWGRKPELWNCRMEVVAFAPLPFSHFPQSRSGEGKLWGPGPQVKGECISKGCTGFCGDDSLYPVWALQDSCRSMLGSADVYLQTDFSGPWFHLLGPCRGLEAVVHAWVAYGGKGQLHCGAGLIPAGGRTGENWQLPHNRNK